MSRLALYIVPQFTHSDTVYNVAVYMCGITVNIYHIVSQFACITPKFTCIVPQFIFVVSQLVYIASHLA